MKIMDDIHERLVETEGRANEVVQRLEQFDALQKSLQNAGQGLDSANTNIVGLTAAAKAAVESLNETLDAFRKAVETVQQFDPAAVKDTFARIEAEIGKVNAKLGALDELASELQDARKALADTARKNHAETREILMDAVRKSDEETRKILLDIARKSDEETRRVVENAVERLSRQTVIDRIFGRYRSP